MGLIEKDNKKYVTILGSDASLRLVVDEGTPKSVVREYEDKNGVKKTKCELVYKSLKGIITDLSFYDGDYGKQLNVELTDGDDVLVLAMSTAQNFGEDFMKKLPNIDFANEVVITPYAFDDESGKTRKGVTIFNKGDKISNFFYDSVKKTNINGYPDPKPTKGDKPRTKDDWKIYFLEARQFLIEYTEEHIVSKAKVEKDKITNDVAF